MGPKRGCWQQEEEPTPGNSLPSGHGFQSSSPGELQWGRARADGPQATQTSPGTEGSRSGAALPRTIVVNGGFKNRQTKQKQAKKTIFSSSCKTTAALDT